MSQTHCREIILPDHIYYEIQLLQKELSLRDGKVWSISGTCVLLLQFYMHEKKTSIQNQSFLQGYLDQRDPFLDEFISKVTLSVH